ncbi:unnamed protein product, partial [Dovyalis caffra]
MKMITWNWEKQEDDYNVFLSLKKIRNQSKSMNKFITPPATPAPHTDLSPHSSSSSTTKEDE